MTATSTDTTPGESSSSSSSNSSKGAITVNPVEMIARLRRHAATIASNNSGNADKTNTTDNDGIYTDDELHAFISMYVQEDIPDYQMSAWLMAVCFCPLTPRETATLTRCYAESGRLLEWPEKAGRHRPPLVDKHSSGGVGDKISLILAPLVAACGVCVPMMAGRGLGHTGGTIDKLETSFPGYQASPESIRDFQTIVLGENTALDDGTEPKTKQSGVGCAIVEAGPDLCPADRRIYALRDVTSTVSCLPLQTASIMSKKIAEHPDSLVLDVKYGNGAFQDTIEDAQKLAESMVSVGEANGLIPTTAFLTDMNHPIGRAVGNWVEAAECIDVMKGNLSHENEHLRLSQDLITLVVVQAGQMLHQSAAGSSSYRKESETTTTTAVNENENESGNDAGAEGRRPYEKYETMSLDECIFHAYKVLDSGKALDKFRDMLLTQGAEPHHLTCALETPEVIPLASFVAVWTYEDEGKDGSDNDSDTTTYIADIPARTIGDVAVDLGAGRTKAGEAVDGQAGIVFAKQTGDPVVHGEAIATLYTNRSQDVANASLERVKASVVFKKEISQEAMAANAGFATNKKIITHMVTREGGTKAFVVPGFLLGGEKGSL